ncbi:MAG TPA: glycosyltransferase family 87 protein [Gemmataceae bacterium]|nr:glycosyltransferase family 87 protein [Gemmataceae bacterium]
MQNGQWTAAAPETPSTLLRVGRFLLRPVVGRVLAWLVAVAFGVLCLRGSWVALDDPARGDGNGGHANVDFGGQWLMGAMVAQGHGRQLYNRVVQRELLRDALPEADQDPDSKRSDCEWLMYWVMGRDDPEAARVVGGFAVPLAAADPLSAAALLAAAQEQPPEALARAAAPQVGGALYPPVHALVYAPLGLLPPRPSYRLTQVLGVLLALPIGWGLRRISGGRISLPVAVATAIAFPGFSNSTCLGQNATLTLTILVWGWVFLAEGRQGLGGALWGLLILKPVWLAAYFLVPLLSGRWRACLAMAGTAALLAALTLPVVGLHSWFDWLEVGKEGAELYKTDENWIHVSRDLLGIPRRWLLDFSLPADERDVHRPAPAVIGWGLWAAVVGATVGVTLARRKQPPAAEGPPAAFLLLGAMFSCFHFMHYDVLLAALPVFLLFTDPWRYLAPLLRAGRGVLWRVLPARLAPYLDDRLPSREEHPGSAALWVAPALVALLFSTKYVLPYVAPSSVTDLRAPWDTFCLLALWAWCGVLWLRQGAGACDRKGAALAVALSHGPA